MRGSCLFLFLSVACLSGCRLDRYNLREPVVSQAIEARSGDRYTIELDENPTTGFRWTAECDDTDIELNVQPVPRQPEERTGVPGKARITVRVHRGFDGPSQVTLRYMRSWSGECAREINLLLYREKTDHAPWH